VTTIQVEVRQEAQQVRVRTFHLPPDPSVSADNTWRAETVVTLDDVPVAAFGPTEEQALLRLGEEVQNTWAARLEKQRGAPPRVADHLNVARPEDVTLNETWLSVHWDREHGCIHAEFKGFTDSLEFRAGTMKILEAVRTHRARGLLSDNRGLEGVGPVDQLWLNDTWMPEAVKAGIRRIAVVLAHHGTGKIASVDIIGRFGKTEFVTRTFDSLPAALTWVAQA
jgi:hypothetical protein